MIQLHGNKHGKSVFNMEEMMKLIKINVKGLPLFKDELNLSFYAQQRVSEDTRDKLFKFTGGHDFYLNNICAMIGVNASGKTSALKVVLLSLKLLANEPVNHIETRDILGTSEEVIMNLYFISDSGELCRLESIVGFDADRKRYMIRQERLWRKPADSANRKKDLTDFAGISPSEVRDNEEMFLPDDVSMIIAYNRKADQSINIESLLSSTNINVLTTSGEVSSEIITYLDPTIEKLEFVSSGDKLTIRLKFYGKKEIKLYDPRELEHYLSSGTIKGIMTFSQAANVLRSGGYLVIDEIENHFNKEIVATLIRFFMDPVLNKKGGSLIFSTHYSEILDEFDRNDCINIIRNRNGITVDNLSDLLKRNDLKKSDVYQSGFLEGTVPTYEAYIRLKRSIRSALTEEEL